MQIHIKTSVLNDPKTDNRILTDITNYLAQFKEGSVIIDYEGYVYYSDD